MIYCVPQEDRVLKANKGLDVCLLGRCMSFLDQRKYLRNGSHIVSYHVAILPMVGVPWGWIIV